ncbi:hypothetical protein IAU60_001035 [Kwoniella sp. DSM 27419]
MEHPSGPSSGQAQVGEGLEVKPALSANEASTTSSIHAEHSQAQSNSESHGDQHSVRGKEGQDHPDEGTPARNTNDRRASIASEDDASPARNGHHDRAEGAQPESKLSGLMSNLAHNDSTTSLNGTADAGHTDMELDAMDGSETAKRPRLRLAHACDRCRRRKIRCDTQHPCTPCQQSNNHCTFETPSRRTVKPKSSSTGMGAASGSGSGGIGLGGSSSSGIKRPHSPLRSSLAGLAAVPGESQANLEARLAALESMLRDVPPNVHNAFLSTLDARLGSGTGVGIKEGGGGGAGVGVAVEALAGATNPHSAFTSNALGVGSQLGTTYTAESAWNTTTSSGGGVGGLNPFGRVGSHASTLAPDWASPSNEFHSTNHQNAEPSLSSWLASIGAGPSLGKRREEVGMDELAKRMEGTSFFYEDEIGQAKWQGATSGFPLLHLLTAANASAEEPDADNEQAIRDSPVTASGLSTSPAAPTIGTRRISSASTALGSGAGRSRSVPRKNGRSSSLGPNRNASPGARKKERFFPDRTPRPHQTLNPEASWKVITGVIPPDLMDTLVRCYLSTSHLLWPFLHVPSFLADYANPQQWGEPGFTCFIVAVCTLSSRHVDDPRVRANPNDPSTAGKQYFELFKRLRDLPSADRPTLYSIQAAFLAAVYAFGLGNLSKAFALQAESITLCLDGGLHRSVDGYDHFDAIEKETRKRTFWSIYAWDKQSAALFGRPPIIHLRDCDVTEPLIVDDENLTPEGVSDESIDSQSRMCAFVATIRLHVILEGVIDSATRPSSFPTSPFLAKAAATIARRSPQNESLQDELGLLEEWTKILPKYWHYDAETAASRDPIRITQAERLHCLEHLVKMIIYRHRFSGFVAMPASTAEERARHLDLCRKAMQCALTIIADHVHISQRGMMTYYGVHVIHQLAQAGRTLVAVILNCRDADFRPLIAPCIEGLRSCVGLLRRFSGRYLCGLRSADIIDEFCRICNIPVNSPRVPDSTSRPSPAWLRPVPKRFSPSPGPSPGAMMDFNVASVLAGSATGVDHNAGSQNGVPQSSSGTNLNDLDALFNTSAYFDMSAIEAGTSAPSNQDQNVVNNSTNDFAFHASLGEPSAPYDRFETLTPNTELGGGNIMLSGSSGGGTGNAAYGVPPDQNRVMDNASLHVHPHGQSQTHVQNQGQPQSQNNLGVGGLGAMTFDYGMNGAGFGGESLATEGMDTVSDGLKGGGNAGLSAATILSLMEEGTFDYGSIFTDQAPLPMDVEG